MSPGKAFVAYSARLAPLFLWKPISVGAGRRAVKGDGRTDEGGGDKRILQEYFGGLGLGRKQRDSAMTKPRKEGSELRRLCGRTLHVTSSHSLIWNRQSVAPWFCMSRKNALYVLNGSKKKINILWPVKII